MDMVHISTYNEISSFFIRTISIKGITYNVSEVYVFLKRPQNFDASFFDDNIPSMKNWKILLKCCGHKVDN